MIVDILTRVSLLAGVGCRHIQHNANVDSVTAGHRRETRGAPDNQLRSFQQSLDKLANEIQIQIMSGYEFCLVPQRSKLQV